MKNTIIALATLAVAFVAYADAATSTNSVTYPVHPSQMAEFNAKTGGMVPPPANAKHLLFLDARAADVPPLQKFTHAAENLLHVGMDVKTVKLGASDCPRKVAFDARKNGAGAVILFYDRPDEPTLNVFPEDAVTLVNLAPLRSDDKKTFSRRFATEFWRSVAFTLGGYGNPSQMGFSMQGLFSLKDFEELRSAGLSPAEMVAINANKRKLGICGRNPAPYSRACREGWAPAPTNDVQRMYYNRFMDPTARFREEYQPKPAAKK